MRVLHVINNLGNGGAERLLVNFLPYLANKGHEVRVLILVKEKSVKRYIEELEQAGVTVDFLKGRGSMYDPSIFFSLNKYLDEHGFSVVHGHLFPTLYYLAFVKRFFVRGESFFFTEHSTQNRRIGNPFFKMVEKFVYKSYNNIITISEPIREKLCSWLDSNKRIIIIRNGINLDGFRLKASVDISSIINSDRSSKFVFMAARFDYPKRQDLLISTFLNLPENYILLLAGEGPNKIRCEKLVNQIGLKERVIFLGHREDVAGLMKSCDLNILYSEYEGMSGVAIEGMASGKPFLGSNVLGINDVVSSEANLFNNFDEDRLREKIIQLCSEDVSELIEQQSERVESYRIESMVDNYVKLYSNAK